MYNFQTINPTVIAENMMQNSELIKQFLSLYLQQIPEDVQNLKNAVTNRNHAESASKAHHIKPTMEYVGATALRQKFQDIETAAKNQIAFEQIDLLIDEADQACSILLEEIKQYLATL